MGIFISQNPGIGGIDELTDSEALFIQQMVGASRNNGDVLTITAGFPTWVAPSGGTAKSAFLATLSSSQSTNLVANNHVEWDTTTFSTGSNITLATGVGQANGLFTLATGKTYQLRANMAIRYSASTDSYIFQWRNNTNGTLLGASVVTKPTTHAGNNDSYPGVISALVTTASSVQVELRIMSVTGTVIRLEGSTSQGSWCEIIEM